MEETERERLATIRKHMRTPIDEVVAEQKLIALIGSERQEILLQIGRPYQVDEEEYRCPVAAWGIGNRYPDMAGSGSLQALFLATRLLESVVTDWAESQCARFLIPDGKSNSESGVELLHAIFGTTDKVSGGTMEQGLP